MHSPQISRRPAFSAFTLVLVLALLLIGMALFVPIIARVRDAAARTQSTNNLKQLGLACHSHHDVFKVFPPAVGEIGMTNGPAHFHLLPFLDQAPLFQNAGTAVWKNGTYGQVVPVFLDPRDESSPNNLFKGWLATTNYPVNWMVFKEGKETIAAITDGASNTLMFAQRYQMCNGQPTAWGYPSIYTWAPMFAYYSEAKFQSAPTQVGCDPALPQSIGKDILAAFCDGSVHTISPSITATMWYYLTDPNDGNVVQFDD